MISKKKKMCGCLVLALSLFVAGCGGIQQAALMDKEMLFEDEIELLYITDIDLNTECNDPVYVDLSKAEDGFTITSGGEYVLSGSYNQTITVDVHDEIVHLFLDNLNVETAIGPAIEIASGGKVVITLMENTVNTLFDAAYYKNEELNATISSACDLTINGSGTLYVCGYFKDAIHTKDVFKVIGSNVQLKAKRFGIKGNDGIMLAPESLMIESEKNGCQTSNANKEQKGIIDIRDGEISIISGQYALSSVSDVYIRSGEVYLNSVIADIYAEGQQYIEEGVFADE